MDLGAQLATFTTIFLGIFIEAAPFLLLGTVASGLVEVFVRREDLIRLMPRRALPATLLGAAFGFAFPVCECGVVPLTRRLFSKGLPISAGIAFLLAAPIINPIVIASTAAAYGWGPMLFARVGIGLIVAVTVGVIFSFNRSPASIMLPRTAGPMPIMGGSGEALAQPGAEPLRVRVQRALRVAADEFFEMGRYLVIGSALAALMQTLVPQSVLTSLGAGPLVSVLVLSALAFVLSVCSTVDAFISLSFVNTFSAGSILAFLVFGPMVDIKSTMMFLGVFRRKIVAYLILLPLLLTTLIAVFINLNVPL
ncbi:MAG: permease [Anaerolineae bacterium]|nr:permease [Anaerolineae bacterium]